MVRVSILPRITGYVETVVNGNHVYRDVETGEIVENPTPKKTDAEHISELKHENTLLRAQVQAMTDRNDFIEDCIAEMAETVYA